MRVFHAFKTILGGMALGLALSTAAQEAAAIKLVVGFPPGGSADTVARVLADKLRVLLRQPVIVENKPGAGGRLAVQALKNSAPDGLTYMIAPNATGVFQTLVYPESTRGFDLLKDLAPVATIVSFPMALAVSTRTGASTAKEYVNWLNAHPKEALFGSAGTGGLTHFSGVQLGKVIGVDLQIVPYRGNSPLITDLLGGQVASGIMSGGDILPHQKGGKIKVVGVFGAERSALMPDVPTLVEQGINVNTGDAWMGMWAPAATSKAELSRMQGALKHVLSQPDVRELLIGKASLSPAYQPAEEMDKRLRKELAYWGPVIKASGFKADQ